MMVDYLVWNRLQSGRTISGKNRRWKNDRTTISSVDSDVPAFVKSGGKKSFKQWALAWLGREILAFPIWTWAFFGGVTVVWRGRRFWVGVDMKVHEIVDQGATEREAGKSGVGKMNGGLNRHGVANGSKKKQN